MRLNTYDENYGMMRHIRPIKHNLELNCYEVELTQNQIGYIDLKFYYIFFEMSICALNSKSNPIFYMRSNDKYLHRLFSSCPKNKIVDHINHNGLDNRICNLRNLIKGSDSLKTKDEKNAIRRDNNMTNGKNRRMNANNKSGYRGVIYKERERTLKSGEKAVYRNWEVEWHTDIRLANGRQERGCGSFSCKLYGYELAKKLAIMVRQEKEKEYGYE